MSPLCFFVDISVLNSLLLKCNYSKILYYLNTPGMKVMYFYEEAIL